MFRSIKRFLVNGIRVIGQKVIDGVNTVANATVTACKGVLRFSINVAKTICKFVVDCSKFAYRILKTVTLFVWDIVKTVINQVSRVILNIVDEIKSYFSDQEKCNKFIVSTGKTLAGMIILFAACQASDSFLFDYFAEEAVVGFGVSYFMLVLFTEYAICLLYRQIKERNITNGYKVTNYKLIGKEPCETFHRVFTTPRPNLIP